jgi:CRISPR-associated protein Csx16
MVKQLKQVKAMSIILVSKYRATYDRLLADGVKVDIHVTHFDINQVRAGDVVIASLPIPLAALITKSGAAYQHLSIKIPEQYRRQYAINADGTTRRLAVSLTAEDIQKIGYEIKPYDVIDYA